MRKESQTLSQCILKLGVSLKKKKKSICSTVASHMLCVSLGCSVQCDTTRGYCGVQVHISGLTEMGAAYFMLLNSNESFLGKIIEAEKPQPQASTKKATSHSKPSIFLVWSRQGFLRLEVDLHSLELLQASKEQLGMYLKTIHWVWENTAKDGPLVQWLEIGKPELFSQLCHQTSP